MVRTRRFYGLVTWKSKVTGTMKTGMIVGLLLILLVGWIISAQRRLTPMDENIKNAMGQIGVQLFSRYEAAIALLELLQPHGEELWKTARWLQEKRRTVTAETEPADAAEQGLLCFRKHSGFYWRQWSVCPAAARKIKTVEII